MKKSVKRESTLDQITIDSTPNVIRNGGISYQRVIGSKRKDNH